MELAQPAAGPFSTFSLWARGTGRDRASVDPPQASRALTPAQAFQPTELGRGEGPDDTEGPEIPSAAIWHDERPRYIQVLDRLPEHRKGQMDPSQGTTQKRQSSPGTHPFDNAITAASTSAKQPQDRTPASSAFKPKRRMTTPATGQLNLRSSPRKGFRPKEEPGFLEAESISPVRRHSVVRETRQLTVRSDDRSNEAPELPRSPSGGAGAPPHPGRGAERCTLDHTGSFRYQCQQRSSGSGWHLPGKVISNVRARYLVTCEHSKE